jgi:5'-phosphate synthase pdxT subunit
VAAQIRVGVLALQGDVREHLAALADVGATGVPVRRPAELADLDGLIIPGGESTTIGKLAVAFEVLEPLRERIADGLAVYGSCAGMILLADRIEDGKPGQPSIGGIDATVRRNAFGRQVDSFEADLSVEGIDGDPVHAVFIRAPWVEQVGPAATPIGRVIAVRAIEGTADGESRGTAVGRIVAVRQGNLLATSFHPELTGDRRIHDFFCDMVKGER